MIEGIPVVANGIGVVSIVVAVGWMIATGRLVTRREHSALERQLEARTAENRDLIEQNGLLLRSSVPTVNAVLGALHHAAEEHS